MKSDQIIMKSFFILIFLLFFNFKSSFSAIVNVRSSDQTCLNNLYTKFNISNPFTTCNTQGSTFRCNTAGGLEMAEFIYPLSYTSSFAIPEDFTCFTDLTDIALVNFLVSDDFIYYKFTKVYNYNYTGTTTVSNSLVNGFTNYLPQSAETYGRYVFGSKEFDNKVLKLSFIKDCYQFYFIGGNNVYVDSENIINNITRALEIQGAINYPNLSKYTVISNLWFTFSDNFISESISNFTTIKDSSTVRVVHSFNRKYPLYVTNHKNLIGIYLTAKLESQSSILDVRSYKNMYFYFYEVGPDFGYQSKFPLIVDNTAMVYVTGANFTVFPDISKIVSSYATINSNLNVSLPIYNGISTSTLDFSNNNLYGTIDKSWCSANLIVPNNKLTGELPSCFSCYLSDSEIYNRFVNNSFTNFNIQPCTTFKPNVTMSSYSTSTIVVTGVDIGFTPFTNWKYGGSGPGQYSTITPGKEYYATWSSTNFVQLKYFSLTFVRPVSVSYTFPSIPQAATPKSAKINGNSIVIPGSFFSSYMGNLAQSVDVSGINCTVTNVNFFELDCTSFDTPFPSTNDLQLLTIKTGILTRRVYIKTIDGSMNNITCSNCDGNNQICDMTSGTCYASCPNDCSGFGTCNNSTGICQCDINRQMDDCSLPYIPCTGTCGKNQHCFNQTGSCVCDSAWQGVDCLTPFVNCSSNCNTPFGQCNTTNGQCVCDKNHTGPSCATTIYSCPNDCNGSNGYCDIYTGICYCSFDFQGDDCSIPYFDCSGNNCFENGVCSDVTGQCSCNDQYFGDECQIPKLYISSIIPSTTDGGEARFKGFFGNTFYMYSDKINLTIGGLPCFPIYNISETEIICEAPPGIGIKTVVITQPETTYTIKGLYKYIEVNKPLSCPNNCSSHGQCNTETGECKCKKGYGSFDCSSLTGGNGGGGLESENTGNGGGSSSPPTSTLPPTETTVDPGNGITNIVNEKTNFQIYFKSLLEINFNGEIVREYSLDTNWQFNNTKNVEVDKYVLYQTIQNGECSIISTIDTIINSNGKEYEFAGSKFTVESGATKFSISINNYKYLNNLNTLQLQFISMVNDTTSSNSNNNCNDKDTEIDTTYLNDQSNFNFIKISKDNKILSGRFINRVESDNKSTFLSTSFKNDSNSIILSLNLPHCVEFCAVDPDFSVLVSPDFSKCDDNSSKNNWVIPVAVILPCFGAAAIAGAGILFYRKVKIENPLKKKLQNIAAATSSSKTN